MKVQIVEQVELFSKAELEILEFALEELEAIEVERVPDLNSISFEDIAEDLEASLESGRGRRGSRTDVINRASARPGHLELQTRIIALTFQINALSRANPKRAALVIQRAWLKSRLGTLELNKLTKPRP